MSDLMFKKNPYSGGSGDGAAIRIPSGAAAVHTARFGSSFGPALPRPRPLDLLADIAQRAKDQGKRPPSNPCVALARRVHDELTNMGRTADHIVADADGGVSFFFFRPCGRGQLSVDNDGDITACTLVEGTVTAWDVYLEDGFQRAVDRVTIDLGG